MKDLREFVEKIVNEVLNEQEILKENTTPNVEVLDFILDIINKFGEYRLTEYEKKYYNNLKNNNYVDKELEKFILKLINKQEITVNNIVRDFEFKYGDKFKKYNYDDDNLSIKPKWELITALRKFFGMSEIKGIYSGLTFEPDMTITDLINYLNNKKESVWENNVEFLKILKQFLFEYLNEYLGILSINGFDLNKIR